MGIIPACSGYFKTFVFIKFEIKMKYSVKSMELKMPGRHGGPAGAIFITG
jgi:hypothetical protein